MTYGSPPSSAPPPSSEPPPLPGSVPRSPRPTTVTAAVGCLVTLAVLSLLSAVINLVARNDAVDAAVRSAEQRPDAPANVANAARMGANVGLIGGVVVTVAFAIAFLVLARFLLRGNNAARVTTWVVCGLSLFCGPGALALSAGTLQYYPAGLRTWTIAATVVSAVLYVAVIVLLALRPSNAFFKPQAQGRV